MSAVMEVIVCSVSMARVRTDSILRKRMASSAFALAMRWIVSYAQARKNVPLVKALASELKEAAAGQGNAIKKRDDTHKMAQANRAFAHFRF